MAEYLTQPLTCDDFKALDEIISKERLTIVSILKNFLDKQILPIDKFFTHHLKEFEPDVQLEFVTRFYNETINQSTFTFKSFCDAPISEDGTFEIDFAENGIQVMINTIKMKSLIDKYFPLLVLDFNEFREYYDLPEKEFCEVLIDRGVLRASVILCTFNYEEVDKLMRYFYNNFNSEFKKIPFIWVDICSHPQDGHEDVCLIKYHPEQETFIKVRFIPDIDGCWSLKFHRTPYYVKDWKDFVKFFYEERSGMISIIDESSGVSRNKCIYLEWNI